MQILKLSLLALPFVFACGGGPSDSDVVADLSISEAEDLCLESVDEFPERTITCSGQSIPVGLSEADCQGFTEEDLPPPGCPATVGQYRACARAQGALTDEQLCSGMVPSQCAALAVAACQEPDQ